MRSQAGGIGPSNRTIAPIHDLRHQVSVRARSHVQSPTNKSCPSAWNPCPAEILRELAAVSTENRDG